MIVLLIVLVVTSGLLAGFFFAWWCSCMVGLKRVSDATFVEAMQEINSVLPNRRFSIPFFAPVILAPVLTWWLLSDGQRASGIWGVIATVFSVITFVVTAGRNVSLNNELAKAQLLDATNARNAFEGPWVRWNTLRTLTSTIAFLASVLALANRG